MFTVTILKKEQLVRKQRLPVKAALTIGRHPHNDIHLPDESSEVSRFHTAIFVDEEHELYLQDLGSLNNTFVNQKKRSYGQVRLGDRIGVGEYTLVFEKTASPPGRHAAIKTRRHVAGETRTVLTNAILPSKLLRRLEHHTERLLLLYELNRIANISSEIEEPLQMILSRLQVEFAIETVQITLLADEEDGLLTPWVAGEQAPRPVEMALLRQMMRERAPVTIPYHQNGLMPEDGTALRSARVLLPLRVEGEIIGTLYLEHADAGFSLSVEDTVFMELVAEDITTMIERGINYQAIREEKQRLEKRLHSGDTVIGISAKLREVLAIVDKIAATDVPALITGERGSGKDMIAHLIHKMSTRAEQPFIAINCSSFPENLIESEIFGHEKGAFTGAIETRLGCFEMANGGTLFLDEIGEMPVSLQPKLLRVLEDGRIRRIGGKTEIALQVRVIAATNRDPQEAIEEGLLREDLFDRLNVINIHMPSLRERKEDIPLLASFFLHMMRNKYSKEIGRFSNACMEFITKYDWPGNVRELKNAVERAVILTNGKLISREHFPREVSGKVAPPSLADAQKAHILEVLEYTGGNKEKALRILGISKQTLYNKGKKYRLPGFD